MFSYPHILHLGIIVECMTQFTNASRKHIYVFIKNFYINSVKWVKFDTDNTGWGSAWWEYTLNPWRERNRKCPCAFCCLWMNTNQLEFTKDVCICGLFELFSRIYSLLPEILS